MSMFALGATCNLFPGVADLRPGSACPPSHRGRKNHFAVPILVCLMAPVLASAQAQEEESEEQQQAEESAESEDQQTEERVEATPLQRPVVIPGTRIEEVLVTGSRLGQSPDEIAANLITLDEDFIRATGEVTLERVLRQLPENSNPTQERFGSSLNTATNFVGASTVNLRGFGSESTLVLIDGKRLGHSGLLGGVSDVSQIPLSMVGRIEILVDGASAVYGSDAVGGVVNIITRKDYQGAEIHLNYNWPSSGGFDEVQGSISGGFSIGPSTRVRASLHRTDHSGMDASDRDVTLFQQSIFSGPQFDVNWAFPNIAFPILYTLNGDVLTLAEYGALSAEDQALAVPRTHAVLPPGFNENSSIDEITEFGSSRPLWGAETQAGYSVLPENLRDSLTFNMEHDFSELLSAELRLRHERRETSYQLGYVTLRHAFGQTNPYNALQRLVLLQGQRRDLPSPATDSESDTLDIGLDFEGAFGDSGWEWEVSFGQSSTESDTLRVNQLNQDVVRAGLRHARRNVPGLTEAACMEMNGIYRPPRMSFGRLLPASCSLEPPPAINPFGDLSPYLQDLSAVSTNQQTRFEALVRGDPFTLPGGDLRFLVGYSRDELVLESATEFRAVIFESPTGNVSNFDTDAERSNQAFFFEATVPLVGDGNRRSGVDSLLLNISGRWDSYDEPSVVFNVEGEGAMPAENLSDPGEEFTWGTGLVYSPVADIRLRVNRQTSFVAPQLNQLIIATGIGPSPPFRGLFLQLPDGRLQQVEIRVIDGGNSELSSETAESLSWGFEISPRVIPGLGFKATWSETEYKDRINQLGNFFVDPNNLPSGTTYDPVEDLYTQDRRWINVSSIDREGVDYDLYYDWSTNLGEFGVRVRHSRTNEYTYVIDPLGTEDPVDVLSHTEGSTAVGVVPRSTTNAQFSWRYKGFEVGLDMSRIDETSSLLAGVTRVYSPPELLDLTLSYEFGAGNLLPTPEFLDGGRLLFTVNNLGGEFGETELFASDGQRLPQQSPDASPLYGRVFNLSYQMSIGNR